jgi:hypothetical protein
MIGKHGILWQQWTMQVRTENILVKSALQLVLTVIALPGQDPAQ